MGKKPYYGPRAARHQSAREQLVFWVICWAELLDALVAVVTFGRVTMDVGPWVLFSDWADVDRQGGEK